MKTHKEILEDFPTYSDAGGYGKHYVLEAMNLAAKQAFEYGRLLVHNHENLQSEIDKEFKDYLKDLEDEQ